MSECLGPELAALMAADEASSEERAAALAHLSGCAVCRRHVEDLRALATGVSHSADPSGLEEPVLHPGTTLGRYQLEHCLGAGGMGVVWAAHDPVLGRSVALKVLRTVGPEAASELRREGRALGRIDDPRVVTLFDVGVADDRTYLVMRRIDGRPMDAWARGCASGRVRLDACMEVAEALVAAHRTGVVHGDVKAANVLVEPPGRVWLTDFGLASFLEHPPRRRSMVEGTRGYIAPELFDGRSPTPASDQFAFGAMLQQVVLERPCDGLSPVGARRVAAVALRARAPQPDERYPSMRHLLRALRRARGARPGRGRVAVALTAVALASWGLVAMPRVETARIEPVAWRGAVELGMAKHAHDLGFQAQARARVDAALSDARARGDELREAEALTLRGRVHRRNGAFPSAQADLRRAWSLAEGEEAWSVGVEAQLALMEVLVHDVAQPEDAMAVEPFVRTSLRRLGGEPVLEARLEIIVGNARLRQSGQEGAAAHFERAEALLRSPGVLEARRLAAALDGQATAAMRAGEYTRARSLWRRADAVLAAEFPPGHRRRSDVAVNIATTLAMDGDYGRAAGVFEQQLAQTRDELGSDQPRLSVLERNLASIRIRAGRTQSAVPLLRSALRRDIARYGPDALRVARTHSVLADALRLVGSKQAWTHAHRAWVLFEASGQQHERAADCAVSLALLEHEAGRLDRAAHWLARAREIGGPRVDVPTLATAFGAEAQGTSASVAALEAELAGLGYDRERPNARFAEPASSLAQAYLRSDQHARALGVLEPLQGALEASGVRGTQWASVVLLAQRAREGLGRPVSTEAVERARAEVVADLGAGADTTEYDRWLKRRR